MKKIANRPWRRLALAGAFALAGCLAPAPAALAQTVTIGASLSQAPNTSFDCTAFPRGDGSTQKVLGNDSSCTWSTPVNPTVPSEGMLTPAGVGTIKTIHLRVGPTTGPMAIVVLQVEEETKTQSVSCCEASYVGQPFTPTANSITTLQTELPVRTDGDSEESSPGLQVGDILGLSILEDGVPIPAIDETHSGLPPNELPSDDVEYPAYLQGQTALESGTGGYQLDMNAEWVSGTTSPPPAPVVTPVGSTPTVTFGGGAPTVKGGAVHLELGCGAAAACKGAIAVENEPPGGAAASASKHSAKIVYAKGPFSLGAGARESLKVPLTAKGRAAVHRHQRVKVFVDVSFAAGSSTMTTSHHFELRF